MNNFNTRITRKVSSKRCLMDIETTNQPLTQVNQLKRCFGTNLMNCGNKNQGIEKLKIVKKAEKNLRNAKQQQAQKIIYPICSVMEIEQDTKKNQEIGGTRPYIEQIQVYLIQRQSNIPKFDDFLQLHHDIDANMRAILVGWIIDVHVTFKLKNQTLFMTIHIIDSYLSKKLIKRNQLQLLGIASLFISCKYEQIYAPELAKFIKVCDNAYNSSQLLEMESLILICLNFDLTFTSRLAFVNQKLQQLEFSIEGINLCYQILDISLIDYKMCKYRASLIGICSIELSNKLIENKKNIIKLLIQKYEIQKNEYKSCMKDLQEIFKKRTEQKFKSIQRKYLNKI